MSALAERLAPCGPIVDKEAASRTHRQLRAIAHDSGWLDLLETAWPALAPVFSASPYLRFLARRRPEGLRASLAIEPQARLNGLVGMAAALANPRPYAELRRSLRQLKMDAHLMIALADTGQVWSVAQVTGALSEFAAAALSSAFAHACAMADQQSGPDAGDLADAPYRGYFALAMGKLGAGELNYSSDADVTIFYDREHATSASSRTISHNGIVDRFTDIIQSRTEDGYVFRLDYRLRPDPLSTPVVLPVEQALRYYEARGQNWERAAFIKARPIAGDMAAAERFLVNLRPFIWRRSLNVEMISDIHSLKRQIQSVKNFEKVGVPDADLKLGPGGIREVEFFVQTQQLILGGRIPSLRIASTLGALDALVAAKFVSPKIGRDLALSYSNLRAWEHRVQMIGDEQTHRLPSDAEARRRVAGLAGARTLSSFDARVRRTLAYVSLRFAELFADEESLSADGGSLVFTGVDDDPATLTTLEHLGFREPRQVSAVIRAWHRGGVPATAAATGREALTRLTPRLLQTAGRTGCPDAAFTGFRRFFEALPVGAQAQGLLLGKPRLLEALLDAMANAPRIARLLARGPAALEWLLGAGEDRENEEPWPLGPEGATLEAAMDAARRRRRAVEIDLSIRLIQGRLTGEDAAASFSDLADRLIANMAGAAWAATGEAAGILPVEVALIAMGKAGSREMSATSDLDLVTIFHASAPYASATKKGWGPDVVGSRFTQRLITALSAPTNEGGLYPVDMRLRPSGTAGPVAVNIDAFDRYYREEAETWELLALTRARVVWSSCESLKRQTELLIEAILRRPRDARRVSRDVQEMRRLIEAEHPAAGLWDFKYAAGGLVDIEFVAQYLQLAHAPAGGPLPRETATTLSVYADRLKPSRRGLTRLARAYRLQNTLSQTVKAALEPGADPEAQPAGFLDLLARRAGAASPDALRDTLARTRATARSDFQAILAT